MSEEAKTPEEVLHEQAITSNVLQPAPETRLVPVELHNINLRIELRVPVAIGKSFEETQSLIARLREKFGEDSLIEELSQVISGTIENVTISRPVGATKAAIPVTAPQPVAVSIPTTENEVGNYRIESRQCPWTGQALNQLDPASIYKVLYESPQHRNLMTQQDLAMMEGFYRQWYDRVSKEQQKKPVQTSFPAQLERPVSFDDDDIPF